MLKKTQALEPPRSAVTLVELVVVIGIMIAVMAVAIPFVRLTTNDNRVSLATQSVRSFLESAAAQADLHGNSYVFFERSANVPDFCYRLYQGRKRPAYRGEDETSYAIMAPNETISSLPGVPPPGAMMFNVFYLYNADAAKLQPFEYLSFRDRPERYLIYQAFQQNAGPGAIGAFMDRPVVKVFCRLDPQSPTNPDSIATSNFQTVQPGSEFQSPPVHPNWAAAGSFQPQRSGGGQVSFWPADLVYYPPSGPAESNDIPNVAPGPPGVITSRLMAFEVSQPPMLDELNYVDLPEGMMIYLGASGFGDVDGFFDSNGVWFEDFAEDVAFGFRADLAALLPDPSPLRTAIENEVQDPNRLNVLNAESLVRLDYYPRLEFEAGGRMRRAFAMSPRFTAANSVLPVDGGKITRVAPMQPVASLFLLVGQDNIQERLNAPAGLLPTDHWVMVGAQSGTTKVVKAQSGVTIPASRLIVSNSVTER